MRGIKVGIHEKDGDGLDVEPLDPRRQFLEGRDVQGCDDLAGGADALGHLEAEVTGHQGLVTPVIEVERVGAVGAGDLQHVAKALGGNQRGPGALALDQRIDDQRGAVIKQAGLPGPDPGILETLEDSFDEIAICGGALGVDDLL